MLIIEFLCCWQKGGAENSIGRMRRFLPGDTDLVDLLADQLIRLLQAHNNTPRKCLGYQTPAELFSNQVLHLKCESTFPVSEEWPQVPRRRGWSPFVVLE